MGGDRPFDPKDDEQQHDIDVEIEDDLDGWGAVDDRAARSYSETPGSDVTQIEAPALGPETQNELSALTEDPADWTPPQLDSADKGWAPAEPSEAAPAPWTPADEQPAVQDWAMEVDSEASQAWSEEGTRPLEDRWSPEASRSTALYAESGPAQRVDVGSGAMVAPYPEQDEVEAEGHERERRLTMPLPGAKDQSFEAPPNLDPLQEPAASQAFERPGPFDVPEVYEVSAEVDEPEIYEVSAEVDEPEVYGASAEVDELARAAERFDSGGELPREEDTPEQRQPTAAFAASLPEQPEPEPVDVPPAITEPIVPLTLAESMDASGPHADSMDIDMDDLPEEMEIEHSERGALMPAPTSENPVDETRAPRARAIELDPSELSGGEAAEAHDETLTGLGERRRGAPPAIDPLPLDKPLPEGPNTWLTKYQIFKAVSQKLARVGDWRKLAAVTGHALLQAPYAERMTRTGMLLDLARIYRDRLKDEARAEQAFAVLIEEDRSSAEALDFLINVYERRGEWESIYDLYLSAVEGSWDPAERLAWTNNAADVATDKLNDDSLAIKAWEHLWSLGDALEKASRELTRLYRHAGYWSELARFLQQQADRLEGAEKLVLLRELAEVKLSGLRDPDGASNVLEQIVTLSPRDPIATLQLARVYGQRKDWESLQRLGQQAADDEVPPEVAMDLQHLVAEALWQSGRRAAAVESYDRILQVDPADYDGNRRKQAYLTEAQRYGELLDLVVAEADSTADEGERAKLLGQAAELAEVKLDDPARAVELWESRIALDAEYLPAFEALTRLYEQMGDMRGVARALEGQLDLTKETARRIELLRVLGDHYASRLQEDERAEACWKEILAIAPADLGTREELIQLHRRRQDYESLNSALMRQIWLTDDSDRAERLCRLAAENLDEQFDDPERSAEAWQRVLDLRPSDMQALQALKRHYTTLGQRRKLIGTLDREIRALDDVELKIERTLEVARLWTAEEDLRGAAESYERILRWDPVNAQALDALVTIYGDAGQRGKAAGALEHASARVQTTEERIALLRRSLEQLPADDHLLRFFMLRRILFLADGRRAVLQELKSEAAAAGEAAELLWPEYAAVLIQLRCQEDGAAERLALSRELAEIYEDKLSCKVRALLALQGVLLTPEQHEEVLEDLSRLARSTERYEDLLAVLDRMTTPEFALDQRKEIIRKRAELCASDMRAPDRAFRELRRLLELDPADREPLVELRRLAEDNSMWRQYDAVLSELWDSAASEDERLDLLNQRESVARDKIGSRAEAFDILVRRFRQDDSDLELLKELTEDAEALGGWDGLLPLLEASQLATVAAARAQELAVTAALFEQKLEDKDRAFTLYALALATDPTAEGLADKLEALAGETQQFDTLANNFREAAALHDDPVQTIGLLRRTARIYEEKLEQPARAIDIHRRLLHLKEDELPSLEKVIDRHREAEEWRDLRDRIEQWIRLAPEEADRVSKLLEVARISEQHLDDPGTALETYGRILELDAEHDAARAGLKGLVVAITEPDMRLRWLRMELRAAEGERRTELHLEIAKLQETELEEVGGAIETLRELAAEAGAAGPAFEPLSALLRQTERWRDLTLLLRAAAESHEGAQEKLTLLDEAVSCYHEHLEGKDGELAEGLYRAVLALRAGDLDIRVRLARLLREAGRFEEVAQLLEEDLSHLGDSRERISTLYELARLRAQNLEQPDAAESAWKRVLGEDPAEENAVLGLAWLALRKGDVAAYVTHREQQAAMLEPHDAALVLCHLAEVCDENEALSDRMVSFYREARRIDPANVPAMEALKGIGRRLKNLRPAAALLPLEGERDLEPEARALRLKALGDAAREQEPDQALEWYHRAVASDPNTPELWRTLADALAQQSDTAGAYRALRGWMHAVERDQAVEPAKLLENAERLYEIASAAREAGDEEAYRHHIHRAYDMVPKHAPSALATARAKIDAGEIEAAHALLHAVLSQHPEELTERQRVEAFYSRGVAQRDLERADEASEDFREALSLDPLHPEALKAMGEMQAASGRYAAAVEYLIRALTVVEGVEERSRLFHRLGVLWEDGLGASEEAGACYELALGGGVSNRDLLHRVLLHLQRTGRLDESLEVVDNLLPTSEDADELAMLWLVRGQIFAAREGQEEQAVEAFDMALSYDPGRHEARDGLTEVLERRGDWNQLLQVLEAATDFASPEQRGEALGRMADICALQLGDQQRAESYLRESVDVHPTREALEQLERIYREAGRHDALREMIGRLVAFGPPWFERCIELAQILMDDDPRWTWCLLSPLLGVSQVDPEIKQFVQGMRKEHERPPILVTPEEHHPLLMHPAIDEALLEVLEEITQNLGPIGVPAVDQAGDGGAIAISENTNMGKVFMATANEVGLEGCTLHRTQALPEAVQIVASDSDLAIVVRTDVLQQLVHAEVGFFFAYALELARPGFRTMAAMPPAEREGLLVALWHALGFTEVATPMARKLAERLKEEVAEEIRQGWASRLEALRDRDPAELGLQLWEAILFTARRAGLVAGPDLRQVFRVMSRLEEEVPRPRVVARIDELDEYIAGSALLQDLVAFAASPEYGHILANAGPIQEP